MRKIGLLAAVVMTLASLGARAADVDTGLVSYTGKFNGTTLILGIASDPATKVAAVVIEATEPSQYDADWTPLTAFFAGKADWARFAALWKKALVAPPGKDMAGTDVGDYLDPQTKVMISVKKGRDGEITFGATNGHHIFLVDVAPEDFDDFGPFIDKVSAYFGE